ncbi:MAG: hypothetical protein JWM92_323 [Candidatus Nomurabacteria bacterium]|nr:hypothetical protein [Candidatus Nomurabacteria bacterium]
MADAPASGGGISGPEIILIVVLAIGLIATLSGNPIKPYSAKPATAPVVAKTPTPQCGITLTAPVKLQQVFQKVVVAGTITPCPTTATPISLYAQVVDGNGTPLSILTPLSIVPTANNMIGNFSATVSLTTAPTTNSGAIIITGPVNSDGTSLTARTPVTF